MTDNIEMEGFGLALVKEEGTTVFYDFDGYDRDKAVARYLRLDRRWFKPWWVRREMDRIMGEIIAYDLEEYKRDRDGQT